MSFFISILIIIVTGMFYKEMNINPHSFLVKVEHYLAYLTWWIGLYIYHLFQFGFFTELGIFPVKVVLDVIILIAVVIHLVYVGVQKNHIRFGWLS